MGLVFLKYKIKLLGSLVKTLIKAYTHNIIRVCVCAFSVISNLGTLEKVANHER